MPTYEYKCKNCAHTFDAFQSMADDPLKICPKCGKEEVRRLINGGTGIIFKGGGFYVTDKKGSSFKGAGSKTAAPKTAETKSSGTEGAACPGCAKSDTCPKAANS